MLAIYFQGLFMGAGLIIAIGAQNAYVLMQAVRRNHHFLLAGICALIDMTLIGVGVSGVGTFIASSQTLRLIASLGGAAFLLWFGFGAARSARQSIHMNIEGSAGPKDNLKKILLALLAVSLLNPHVYLDTVVMLGAISGSYPGNGRYIFGLGAITASFIWFFSLAFFGSWLAPVFSRPKAWQVLNALVAIMVWMIAASLLFGVWRELAAGAPAV